MKEMLTRMHRMRQIIKICILPKVKLIKIKNKRWNESNSILRNLPVVLPDSWCPIKSRFLQMFQNMKKNMLLSQNSIENGAPGQQDNLMIKLINSENRKWAPSYKIISMILCVPAMKNNTVRKRFLLRKKKSKHVNMVYNMIIYPLPPSISNMTSLTNWAYMMKVILHWNYQILITLREGYLIQNFNI